MSWLLLLSLFLPATSQAELVLSPQKVQELTLSQGLQTQTAILQQRRAYLSVSQALGVFDLQFIFTPGYEYNKAQQLSGQANVVDKTFTLGSSLSKRFTTGTALSLDYVDTRQRSVLGQFAAANRLPTANLNSLQLSVRQSIFANAFGEADRAAVEIARESVKAAVDSRDESIEETLLNSLTLFWNAYVAERNHRQYKNIQERYGRLINDVRRRKGYALTSPAELPRLEAELQDYEALERSSWVTYTNAVNALLVAIRVTTTETVSLFIPPEIPEIPALAPVEPETLRSVRIAQTTLKNASRNLDMVESRTRPTIDLVARARTTGVDPNHESARLEMGDGKYPTYFVGVELIAPLWSEAFKGQRADARVQKMIAENNAALALDTTKRVLNEVVLTTQARYEVVKLATSSVEQREKVVTEIERAYRQGRQPLVEVIRAYNELTQARFNRASAVGDYNLALASLSAARDELVPRAQDTPSGTSSN